MFPRIALIFVTAWVLFAGCGFVRAEKPSDASPFLIRPIVDDRLATSDGPLDLPSGRHNLAFRVLTSPRAIEYGVKRLRTRLDRWDQNWKERPSEMGIMLRFVDATASQIGVETYVIIGNSPGWKGSMKGSEFNHRVENVQVPNGAVFLNIVLSSAGPPTAVGMLAISNLTVRRRGTPENQARIYPEPPGDNQAPDKLTNWRQNGTKFLMAKLRPTGLSPGHPALIIEDDSVVTFAEWGLRPEAFVKVESGSQIEVAWDELYTIGDGAVTDADMAKLPLGLGTSGRKFASDAEKPDYALGAKTSDYKDLPAGTYTFRVQGLDWLGNPLPIETVFRFTIEPPFWRRPVVIGSGAMVALMLGMLILRRRSVIRTRREMEQMRQDHLLETERLRIARNIHDDLGARLTHISLMSENARAAVGTSSEAAHGFENISKMTRDLVNSLYETIWTVDPQNDNLESLLDFLCESVQNLCESAKIRCKISMPEATPGSVVSSDLRHNLVLAVKEAVNNAVKHSGASCLELNARFVDTKLVVEICDDGLGFDVETIAQGYGLASVRKRLEDLNGECRLERRIPRGTRVILETPLGG